MNNSSLEVIIVGAGHAGLAASYYLKQQGIEQIVFERGKVGESWRSQRWDSFTFNTANKLNALPGDQYKGDNPDGFCSTTENISSLEKYVATFQLPVSENAVVLSVEKNAVTEFFNVTVSQNNSISQYPCRQVIIASGSANERNAPSFAGKISPGIKQLHASEYRNSLQLPDGAILVTGSAQSGCQVAEDLADAGRKVYLSTSMVGRIPRRYRGKDIMDWLIMMKFFDMRKEDIKDPAMLRMKVPQLTGTGGGGRTISLQSLSQRGITILGKMENADEKSFYFQPNAATHVHFADGFSKKVKDMVDDFILKSKLTAPLPEIDHEDIPDIQANCVSSTTSLDLEEHNIRSVIWATGFGADLKYIKLPVMDYEGNPKHTDGVSDVEGLYFLGMPWLRSRKSTSIFGLVDDAAFICEKVYHYSKRNKVEHAN